MNCWLNLAQLLPLCRALDDVDKVGQISLKVILGGWYFPGFFFLSISDSLTALVHYADCLFILC
jgi:hypothetical protein